MAALREILAEFGIEVATENLEHANRRVENFIDKLKDLAKVAAGAFAIKEIFEFAEHTAAAINVIESTATALGVSTEAVQQFGYAAAASGNNVDLVLNSLGKLQIAAANTEKGGGEIGKAFRKLGVDTSNIKKLEADELFMQVAEGISKIENPTDRAAAAVEVFGKQGRELLPFLMKGREGIAGLREEFDLMGGGFDPEAIELSGEFEHSVARLRAGWDGVRNAIVKGLFPPLTWVINKVASAVGWFVQMSKHTNVVRNGLLALAVALTPLAIQMAIAFAPLLLAVAAVGAVWLAVDELITLFEGGETVIGDVVDKIFGKGTSADFVTEIKREWQNIKTAFEELWPIVKNIWEAFKWMVDKAGAIGGGIGDMTSRFVNKVNEATGTGAFANQGKGRGGLTYEENAAALEAQRRLTVERQGGTTPILNKPSTVFQQDWEKAVSNWMTSIQTDTSGRFAKFQPQAYGTYSGPAETGAPATNVEKVEVNVNGANMTNEQVGKVAAEKVGDALRNVHRNAKHLLTRAAPTPAVAK